MKTCHTRFIVIVTCRILDQHEQMLLHKIYCLFILFHFVFTRLSFTF
jgi:hypothetical protein